MAGGLGQLLRHKQIRFVPEKLTEALAAANVSARQRGELSSRDWQI
jgi:hypothetical protein